MSDATSVVYRRHSLLKRSPALSRAMFLRHYEHCHGPLACGLASFYKYSMRYVQNHVENLPDGGEPLFDAVSINTQIPRDDYRRTFFDEPEYEQIAADEKYLMDLTKTVSVLGREEVLREGPHTSFKAIILTQAETLGALNLPSSGRLILNHFDLSMATILPSSKDFSRFGLDGFGHNLLAEVWYDSEVARTRSFHSICSSQSPAAFLPVREIEMFNPQKPWTDNSGRD